MRYDSFTYSWFFLDSHLSYGHADPHRHGRRVKAGHFPLDRTPLTKEPEWHADGASPLLGWPSSAAHSQRPPPRPRPATQPGPPSTRSGPPCTAQRPWPLLVGPRTRQRPRTGPGTRPTPRPTRRSRQAGSSPPPTAPVAARSPASGSASTATTARAWSRPGARSTAEAAAPSTTPGM